MAYSKPTTAATLPAPPATRATRLPLSAYTTSVGQEESRGAALMREATWWVHVPLIGDLTYSVLEKWQHECTPRYYAPRGH